MRQQHQSESTPPQRGTTSPGRRWLRRLFLCASIVVGLGMMLGLGVGIVMYRSLAQDLPQLEDLKNYSSSLPTKVYDRHGELIADFFIEKRILVDLEKVPLYLRQATIAVEDSRFYRHNGIDLIGIARAMWVNAWAGAVREGASTITQQVARTLFLSRERTLRR
ncbi:MAG: transglycosylase domain-containing protein, partial [Candidatus Tectomicrobia bacterium]